MFRCTALLNYEITTNCSVMIDFFFMPQSSHADYIFSVLNVITSLSRTGLVADWLDVSA